MDLNAFTSVPPQVRATLGFLAGGSFVAVIMAFDRRLGMIAMAGLALTALLIAAYKALLKKLGKKRASDMSGQIKEHSASAPLGINDPARRARLDDLTRNFDSGLQKFRTSGKDVYKLPWYLIVGEPGSGKTEAVRHCNVGFPPGLQDELQGTGGTINMNWWFTNHAVMLDTAGRLMFEEVKPGETSEWREFLQLLARNRPNCPINGLLLVIPAESLIRDTTESIAQKAGKIAQQFDLIQRTLDVRFPVFVLITKCDLLSGFREFFEGLNDPSSQHQMLGWSNPEPRDSPFQPARVTEYLQTVVERVGKRRLGLMRDPVPEKEGGKRADEVDALYGLPNSLSLIGPRLKSYLEAIFVAGEWSAKPLFLRGIYFTSAMREGAALDQELAEALGVSLDDLPEGRAWERERAYFLRDLFMDKAFREKGLVTRATNTNKLVQRRRLLLFGTGSLAFLALLGVSILGYLSLKESVGRQSHFWMEAKQGWNNGIWHPIVEKGANGQARYTGDAAVSGTEPMSLAEYHDKVRELCEKEIEISWAFKPVAKFARLEGDRKKAQRILFEGGVISPLVQEARRKMMDPAGGIGTEEGAGVHQAQALAALIGIESDTVSAQRDPSGLAEDMVSPLLRYTTGQEKPADAGNFKYLANTLLWTYTKNPNGQWPPPWLSAGTSLAANKPIAAGLERLLNSVYSGMQGQESGLADVRKIRDLLRAFRQKETDLNAAAVSTEARDQVYVRINTQHGELGALKQQLDQALKEMDARQLVPGERFTVSRAYEVLVGGGQAQSKASFDIVQKAVAAYAAKPSDPVNTNHPLFVQVDAKLKEVQADIERRIAGSFTVQEQQELKALDLALLADIGSGQRSYEARWSNYDLSQRMLREPVAKDGLVGKNWSALAAFEAKVNKQRQAVAGLKEKLPDPFAAANKYFLDRAQEIQVNEVLKSYVNESRAKFADNFFYPLVNAQGGKGGRNPEGLLAAWKKDLKADTFQQAIPFPEKEKLLNFLTALGAINLANSNANGSVTVSVLDYAQSPNKAGVSHFRSGNLQGNEFDTSREAPSASFPYNGTFSVDFYDYNVTPKKRVSYSRRISDLLSASKGGGRMEISVDGYPIYIVVTPKGSPPPDPGSLPDKVRILSTLN